MPRKTKEEREAEAVVEEAPKVEMEVPEETVVETPKERPKPSLERNPKDLGTFSRTLA